MKERLRLYFDTSVWSRLIDNTERGALTRGVAAVAERDHVILSSLENITELSQTRDETRRSAILELLRKADPELIEVIPEVRLIAKELLNLGGWGPKDLEDMLHIGYALVGHADVLLTWDEDDLAREKTRKLVRQVCRARGLKRLEIVTPEEAKTRWLGGKTPRSRS